MHLIASTGGNRFLTAIALKHGFLYGAQLPTTVRHDVLFFADQDWKRPEKHPRYLEMVAEWCPHLATVVDIEVERDMDRAMKMAEQIIDYVDHILWIPKLNGCVDKLPRELKGKKCMLAYSVPTKYGGTTLPLDDFHGWDVHLLGGSPINQASIVRSLHGKANVYSIDGNFWVKQATRFCQFFVRNPMNGVKNKHWPTLKEYDGVKWDGNGPEEAFRRSCVAVLDFWKEVENDLRGIT